MVTGSVWLRPYTPHVRVTLVEVISTAEEAISLVHLDDRVRNYGALVVEVNQMGPFYYGMAAINCKTWPLPTGLMIRGTLSSCGGSFDIENK